ncbi:MAG: hypothetical protein VZQ83_09330, partial [Eubacterium sp.]|nr:hypothetical protein [Eubacterium sp.]
MWYNNRTEADMDEKASAFDQALSNFTFGVANRDLICHMAAEGYSVRQIKEATDYPVSVSKIAETVWDYYLETGVIRLDPPGADDKPRYDYVMDIGKYGKRSFRRVEVSADECAAAADSSPTGDGRPARATSVPAGASPSGSATGSTAGAAAYIPCDFGIVRAEDPRRFEQMLDTLDSRKRDYIDGLPWPPQVVYHIDNLAIREIRDILREKGLWGRTDE